VSLVVLKIAEFVSNSRDKRFFNSSFEGLDTEKYDMAHLRDKGMFKSPITKGMFLILGILNHGFRLVVHHDMIVT